MANTILNETSRLTFKPHYLVEIIEPAQVVLFSEDKHFLLQGEIYVALAQLLEKKPESKNAIFENLKREYSEELIQQALQRLTSKGFIAEHADSIPSNIAAFWSDVNLPASQPTSKSVTVLNFSQHDPGHLINALEDLSVMVNDAGDFFIVVTDNYISKELELFNTQRLQDEKPWMLLKPTGRILWIGPIFVPDKTGCWNCLAHSIKENRRVEVDLFGPNNEPLKTSLPVFLPTSCAIAMNLAANEVAKWLRSPHSHPLHHNLITFDLGSLELKKHAFKSRTACSRCKSMSQTQEPKVVLSASKKRFFYETGERNCSWEESFDKVKDIVSPITGVVSSINHSVVNEEHICYTVRTLPFPKTHDKKDRYLRVPDAATGKGKNRLQATVGCVAEAIERYNCSFSTQPEIRCSFDEMKHQAIHPHLLLNFSDYQYNHRESINSKQCGFNRVPKQYNGSKIGWTATHSLLEDRIIYVPSSYCYLYYPFENDVEMCPGNSNGCASGNTLEEAIFYGMLELVERDAVGIWWYNRLKRPCVDLDQFNNILFNRTRDTFKAAGREFYVLDLTTDLEIPCYAAVSWKLDGSQIFFGTGAHLNPALSIARAISELNQTMIRADTPTNINLFSIPEIERSLVKWSITEKLEDHPYFIPSELSTKSYLYKESENFLIDIQTLLSIFQRHQMQVLVQDLSNPDIPFHTARVIIPGLRHFWARLAPGRLYETPVKLGWIKDPLKESSMNPISYFL